MNELRNAIFITQFTKKCRLSLLKASTWARIQYTYHTKWSCSTPILKLSHNKCPKCLCLDILDINSWTWSKIVYFHILLILWTSAAYTNTNGHNDESASIDEWNSCPLYYLQMCWPLFARASVQWWRLYVSRILYSNRLQWCTKLATVCWVGDDSMLTGTHTHAVPQYRTSSEHQWDFHRRNLIKLWCFCN